MPLQTIRATPPKPVSSGGLVRFLEFNGVSDDNVYTGKGITTTIRPSGGRSRTYSQRTALPKKQLMTYEEANIPEPVGYQTATIPLKTVWTSTPPQRREYAGGVKSYNVEAESYNKKISESKKQVDEYNKAVKEWNKEGRYQTVTQTITEPRTFEVTMERQIQITREYPKFDKTFEKSTPISQGFIWDFIGKQKTPTETISLESKASGISKALISRTGDSKLASIQSKTSSIKTAFETRQKPEWSMRAGDQLSNLLYSSFITPIDIGKQAFTKDIPKGLSIIGKSVYTGDWKEFQTARKESSASLRTGIKEFTQYTPIATGFKQMYKSIGSPEEFKKMQESLKISRSALWSGFKSPEGITTVAYTAGSIWATSAISAKLTKFETVRQPQLKMIQRQVTTPKGLNTLDKTVTQTGYWTEVKALQKNMLGQTREINMAGSYYTYTPKGIKTPLGTFYRQGLKLIRLDQPSGYPAFTAPVSKALPVPKGLQINLKATQTAQVSGLPKVITEMPTPVISAYKGVQVIQINNKLLKPTIFSGLDLTVTRELKPLYPNTRYFESMNLFEKGTGKTQMVTVPKELIKPIVEKTDAGYFIRTPKKTMGINIEQYFFGKTSQGALFRGFSYSPEDIVLQYTKTRPTSTTAIGNVKLLTTNYMKLRTAPLALRELPKLPAPTGMPESGYSFILTGLSKSDIELARLMKKDIVLDTSKTSKGTFKVPEPKTFRPSTSKFIDPFKGKPFSGMEIKDLGITTKFTTKQVMTLKELEKIEKVTSKTYPTLDIINKPAPTVFGAKPIATPLKPFKPTLETKKIIPKTIRSGRMELEMKMIEPKPKTISKTKLESKLRSENKPSPFNKMEGQYITSYNRQYTGYKTGQEMRSEIRQKLIQIPKISFKTKQALGFAVIGTMPKQEQILRNRMVEDLGFQPITKNVQRTDIKNIEKNILLNLLGTATQTQTQTQDMELRYQQQQFQMPILPNIKSTPRSIPSFKRPKPKLTKETSEFRDEAYVPMVRVGKKYKAIKSKNKMNYYYAMHKGAEIVDNTTARNFKLKKVSGKPSLFKFNVPSNINKFYQPSKTKRDIYRGAYIEKSRHAIDSFGEKQGLSVARYLKKFKM